MTLGYDLPSKHVLHAVGPIYSSSRKSECQEALRGCYQRSLQLAAENNLKSIAFNCISTGEHVLIKYLPNNYLIESGR